MMDLRSVQPVRHNHCDLGSVPVQGSWLDRPKVHFHGDRMAGFAEVRIEFLPTEKGGRRTPVCLSADSPGYYRPHFRVRGGNGEMLGVEFIDGPDEPITPGTSTFATVRFLFEPDVCYEALVVGAEFELLEGPRVVGIGRVTRR